MSIRMDTYEVLLLDVGGTLIQPQRGVGGVYGEVALEHGVVLSRGSEAIDREFQQVFQRLRHQAAERGRLAYGRTEDEAREFWWAVVREVFEPEVDDRSVLVGLFDDLPQAAQTIAVTEERLADASLADRYNTYFRVHQALYPQLKPAFAQLQESLGRRLG